MEIIVNSSIKIVEIWLSKSDVANQDLRSELVTRYKGQGLYVVFYESGVDDLYKVTLNLLQHNRLSADVAAKEL